MTPTERAEKIATWFENHIYASRKEGLEFIAAQIAEAERVIEEKVIKAGGIIAVPKCMTRVMPKASALDRKS